MTFHTQSQKDTAVVAAQKVVDNSQGQAKVNAQAVLDDTNAATITG